MASWFTRLSSRQPQAQLGPPWAVPEAQLFDDDEDPDADADAKAQWLELADEVRALVALRLSLQHGVGKVLGGSAPLA